MTVESFDDAADVKRCRLAHLRGAGAARSTSSSPRNAKTFSLVSRRRPSEVIDTSSAVRGWANLLTRSCSCSMDLTSAATHIS